MKALLEKLIAREDLTSEEATDAMELIARGKADPIQVGSFLTLLQAKEPTAVEITALVRVMLDHCNGVDRKSSSSVLDIVGTGGDGANTVNLSTGAAILAAACGAKVAKHGNRSVSSRSGSADVLETMGIPFLHPEKVASCIDEAGIAFMYSPNFHPAMKHVVPVRRAVGVRTVFNILGPLLNPARCETMLVGVYTPELLKVYGEVYHALGIKHAVVIHCAGLDELNPMGVAEGIEVTPDGVKKIEVDPSAMGIASCTLEDLKGGDAEENAKILKSVFAGGDGAKNAIGDTIALNAGAGLYVYGMAKSIKDGYEIAKEKLLSGAALQTLNTWCEVSQKLHKTE